VSEYRPGTEVSLGVYRRSETQLDTLLLRTELAAAPMAASDADEFEFEPFEMTVRDLVFSDFLTYNIDQNSLEGVVVTELSQGGLANISGLRPGDVIQRVNDSAVGSVSEITFTLEEVEAAAPAEVVFFVWRFGQTMFVNVKTDW
jgi:serine protease Do